MIKCAGKGEAVVCTERQEIAVQSKRNFATGGFKKRLFKILHQNLKWAAAKTLFLDPARFSNGVEPSETNYRHP